MERKEFDTSVLDDIKPFSGDPTEMRGAGEMINSGMALQQVKTAYATAVAVQKPRSIAQVTRNVLAEAAMAGSAFYFRWPVKNRKTGKTSIVQGPSVDLAMCVARNWGNAAMEIDVQETHTHYMFKASFVDLETGFTVPRLFRQRKGQDIGGGYGDDRAEDMVFQIGQSKAQRNAINKAMPGWLLEQAIEVARDSEIKGIKPENLVVARAKVLDFFSKYGITADRVEAVLERGADMWTAEDIVNLRASATALKEGRITANELFPPIEQPTKESDPTTKKTTKAKEKAPATATIEKEITAEQLDAAAGTEKAPPQVQYPKVLGLEIQKLIDEGDNTMIDILQKRNMSNAPSTPSTQRAVWDQYMAKIANSAKGTDEGQF